MPCWGGSRERGSVGALPHTLSVKCRPSDTLSRAGGCCLWQLVLKLECSTHSRRLTPAYKLSCPCKCQHRLSAVRTTALKTRVLTCAGFKYAALTRYSPSDAKFFDSAVKAINNDPQILPNTTIVHYCAASSPEKGPNILGYEHYIQNHALAGFLVALYGAEFYANLAVEVCTLCPHDRR